MPLNARSAGSRDTFGRLGPMWTFLFRYGPPRWTEYVLRNWSGQRLVIAWADRKGAVTLAIHDARADWRRIAEPEIGPARGAVVAWLR